MQLVALAAIVTTLFISAVMTTFVSAATTRIVADAYVGQPDDGQTLTDVRRHALPFIGLTIVSVARRVRRSVRSASFPGCGCRSRGRSRFPSFMLERTSVFKALGRSYAQTKATVLAGVRRGLAESAADHRAQLRTGGRARLGHPVERQCHGRSHRAVGELGIATTITLPFAAAALVVLYFDLRIRTEAFDVQMMIARLDASRAADAMPA